MAIEPKRRCGYRKVGGIYLIGEGEGIPCGKLPCPVDVCPTCSQGIKQSRGWTWINGRELFLPRPCENDDCECCALEIRACPLGNSRTLDAMTRAGLLWIGERFYKTVGDFQDEARRLGISKRIAAIPRGFVVGETWIFLAHPKGIQSVIPGLSHNFPMIDVGAAIFRVFRPVRIEILITQSQANQPDFMEGLTRQGLTPVIVPDDDKDHQGTVYDKPADPELFDGSGGPNGKAASDGTP